LAGCVRFQKLDELTIEKKKGVLDLIAKGVGKRAIAVQSGVAKSTIGNICKNRDNTEGLGRKL
jgi:DNA invertase Pin-like site-specific DNA recombinase